jgi:NAD(P)-dependent dehydrogenase (short-subunit alcohol dehydrogenase family)
MGKATALKLARNETRVILVGRTAAKLEATAAEIKAKGGECVVFPADVTQAGALDGLRGELEAGGLDVLVNCAGEALLKSIDQTTLEDWQRIIAVNLTTAYIATSAALPYLRKSANASIVLLASKVALRGAPVVAYAAAKGGVLSFARALSVELKTEGIRVVAICPGPTDTPMRWNATPDMSRDIVISAETVADTIAYVVALPRGTTTGEILVQAELYE